MRRLSFIAGLSLMLSTVGIADLAAAPIDPIVRTRAGGGGSVHITELPFDFTFPLFPAPYGHPDNRNCWVGHEDAGTVLTCAFQNVTGQTISQLDFRFTLPQDHDPLVFSVEDPNNLFSTETINETGARFAGGGILSATCDCGFDRASSRYCSGGHFFIDLVGFPVGTSVSLTASQVPEPATLALVGMGLALAGGRARRRLARHVA